MRRRVAPAARVRPRTLRTLAVAITTGAVLSACSSGASPGVQQSSPSGKYVTGSSGGYALYQSASENRTFVNSAIQELIRRCMVGAGFQYWPVPDLPAQYKDPARPLSLSDAKVRGYRALDPPTNAPGSTEREAYLSSLTPDQQQQYDHALTGDGVTKTVDTPAGKVTYGAGGCTAKAFTQLVPDPSKYISLDYQVANLTSLSEFQPAADPGLKSASTAWAACMTSAGYHYTSPEKAIEAAAQMDSSSSGNQGAPLSDQPSPGARAIAVADATCRVTSHWDTANRVAVHNSLAVVVDAHQADILSYNEMAAAATQKAKEILGR